jgi:hypothetical protein
LSTCLGAEANDTYNVPEHTAWMKAAGISEVHRVKLPGPTDLIVGRVK